MIILAHCACGHIGETVELVRHSDVNEPADIFEPRRADTRLLLKRDKKQNSGEHTESGASIEEISLVRRAAFIATKYNLTKREQEILIYLARGRSVRYIAETLVISENTAWTHTKRIYSKTGVHNKQELMSLVEEDIPR